MSSSVDGLPFVSVVVPTRDRPELLAVALRGLCRQSYPRDRFEVLIVEDGGSERTERVVDGRGDCVASVRYLARSAEGVNACRNAGFAAAAGDIVVFTDDDVEAPSGWLTALVEGSRRHPGAGCFGGPVRIRFEGEPPSFCSQHSLGKGELDLGDREVLLAKRHLLGANLAVTRSAVESVGGFHEEMLRGSGADFEWQARYRAAGGSILYVPAAWLWHRRTPEMLRLRLLLWQRFVRELLSVRYLHEAGHRVSIRAELRAIPQYLRHAVRDGCIHGWLRSAMLLGKAVGGALDRLGLLRATERGYSDGGPSSAEGSGSPDPS